MRHPWRFALIVVGVIAAVMIAALVAIGSRVSISSEAGRVRLIAALESQLDAKVELDDLRLRVFPRLRAEGHGLRIRHKGRRDVPPLISIARFAAEGSVISLYRRHVTHVSVEGLDIEIPPDRNRGGEDTDSPRAQEPATDDPSGTPQAPLARTIVVDEMVSTNAKLVIIPKEPGKSPRTWAIHQLRMHNLGVSEAMPFEASLTNAVPPGDIQTSGAFGPWHAESPGSTPLRGTFLFDHADLGFFKGISGILSARGTFGGSLDRIDIHGETDTPQFRAIGDGNPVPLHAAYHAIVDGTNGNTILDPVNASFLNTSLIAKGSVIDTPGKPGRVVKLDITMDKARLEDVLRLAVKSSRPPMTGALRLTTTFVLPPGDGEVVQRLQLNGRFAIADTRFTDAGVQTKINELSHRSRAKAPVEAKQNVSSQFDGSFRLGGGILTIPAVTFDVPGSLVRLSGTYALVPETIDFSGTLEMDAKMSQLTTGFKSKLLSVLDPVFAKKGGGGTEIPIKISGVRRDPSFGLDMRRLFKRRSGKS